MPYTDQEKKEALLDELVARVRAKCSAPEAALVEAFTRNYYRQLGPEDLLDRPPADLYGAALAHWQLAWRRRPGERLVRAYNPHVEQHGWQSTHTIVEVVQEDMPFLVDSVRMELNRQGLTLHLTIHPVMNIRRDSHGQIVAIDPERSRKGKPGTEEAILHFEVDRQTDPAKLARVRDGVHRVLEDVRAAVEDFRPMRERLAEAITALTEHPPGQAPDEVAEAVAFLRWLDHDNFTFLGYREYRLDVIDGESRLHLIAGSGLGVTREPRNEALVEDFSCLPAPAREAALQPVPLVLTKGSSQATVHRRGYLDSIGVRHFDGEGRVLGERRFLGRYTSAAYTTRPKEIPLLRRKVAQVIAWSQLRPGSHSAKALLDILEDLPRDELFLGSANELFTMATGILHLQERQRVRLLVRHDPFLRYVSCLVYLPRDRFRTEVRQRIQALLCEAFEAHSVEFSVALSESALARLYLTLHLNGRRWPDYRLADLEARIVAATRSWSDELQEALRREFGEEDGNRLFAGYRAAFPASYSEEYSAAVAVHDIRTIESLPAGGALGIQIYRPLEASSGQLRIKLLRRVEPISLSTVLPMLENMGVTVTDERPHAVHPAGATPVWIHDLGMRFEPDGEPLDSEAVRQHFSEAFARVWDGRLENDGFNRLVLHAGYHWRQTEVIRTCCKYLLQTEFPFSQRYMEQVLVGQPQIARLLIDLFQARFDPSAQATSAERSERLSDAIVHSLEAIPNLDEDRILRRFFLLIRATLRTNYFQTENGGAKTYLAIKLDPTQLPDLPEPRPRYEIFIYSVRTEAVHLRGGKVARGGIRWSDRLEDYRTEVFGLMKAQMVKNAVIVPVGAKGGFVVKHPPPERQALADEVIACYSLFIRGLLDLTDNRVGEQVVGPVDTVCYDDADPYLVVAADKGTAGFSDIANRIAAEYRFWLGDAFASGGSTGYDHKKMAITARGAWESVKRHFRERGLDIRRQDFTVVGIGGMNGDVFGNGMLLSPHIRLVAAFSHQHIFLDPDPDPATSLAERRRLFENTLSWGDYDPAVLSPGGGIFSRHAKSIPLTPAVRRRLGIEADDLSPNALIRAILQAPVDLLWNGGIGTFVKASDEEHESVGDRTNDPIRVDARTLRCRVVGEGGNLGLTQRARIEFARTGGGINTDFIDNSGGVDTSDHEVNIKILLEVPICKGLLDYEQRNRLLAGMAADVAERVLSDSRQQCEALSMSEYHASELLDEHTALLHNLERRGYLERHTWALPDDEVIGSRRLAGEGLTRPELAVLLAYAKIALFDALLAEDFGDDPELAEERREYFPTPVVERFPDEMDGHRLHAELVSTFVANRLVNLLGITAALRLEELSGSSAAEIARAFLAARRIFELPELWGAVTGLAEPVTAAHQLDCLDEIRRLANSATLWLLRHPKGPASVTTTVARYRPAVEAMQRSLADLLDPVGHTQLTGRIHRWVEQGVPLVLAERLGALPLLLSALDIGHVAGQRERPVPEVGRLYFAMGSALGVNWMRERVAELPVTDHWARLAREALRDDLYHLHRRLTIDALHGQHEAASTAQQIAGWVDTNQAAVEHYQRRMEQFRASPSADFPLLSVVLGELRRLLRGNGTTPADW